MVTKAVKKECVTEFGSKERKSNISEVLNAFGANIDDLKDAFVKSIKCEQIVKTLQMNVDEHRRGELHLLEL